MKQITMRYKGFSFTVNPKSVQLYMAKNIRTARHPFATAGVQEIGDMPCTVKASGSFCGNDAEEQALRLTAVFRQKGAAYLFAPTLPAVRMFFQSLSISSDAADGSLHYTVTFVEETGAKKPLYPFGYTLARAEENLFDIANRTGVATEQLFAANDFETLFSVREGDRVWLP